MKIKILIVKTFIPKYDFEFYQKLALVSNLEIYVTSDTLKKNQLNADLTAQKKFHSLHTKIIEIGPFVFSIGLQKVIRKINPDIIVFGSNPRDIALPFRLMLNKYIYRYKVVTWSMYHRIGGQKLFSSLMYKLIGKISDRSMSYTNIGANYQIERGISSEKIDVIGTAVDEKRVFKIQEVVSEVDKESLLDEYNLKGKFVLLQVLRLSAIKKPFLLVDMMKLLVRDESNVRLVLIGGGELEEELKLYVKANNLENYFIFLGPMYDEIELAKWFNIAQVFVIPTCVGLSAHHAFCYGLPIVTDNSKNNQASEFDILKNKYNCLLYKEGDMNLFSEKIIQLKQDQNLYKKLSKNALKTVKEEHTLGKKVDNFISSIDRNF